MENKESINSKSGISLMVLVIAIGIMFILISSVSVVGYNSIVSANYEKYQGELSQIADLVNVYYIENKSLPVTNEIIDPQSISYDFINETIDNNDEFNKLLVIDMNKIDNLNIKKGKGNISNQDIYVVSENAQNIYYVKGFKFEGKTVYGNIK